MLRTAEPLKEDVVKIYDLLMDMHKNTGLSLPKVHPPKVLQRIGHAISQGMVFLAERPSGLVGALGVCKDTPWWSQQEHLADTFFYVKEGERHGGVAVKLLKAAQKYASAQERPLFINLLTGKDLFRKEMFLARLGFERVGSLYVQSMRV